MHGAQPPAAKALEPLSHERIVELAAAVGVTDQALRYRLVDPARINVMNGTQLKECLRHFKGWYPQVARFFPSP